MLGLTMASPLLGYILRNVRVGIFMCQTRVAFVCTSVRKGRGRRRFLRAGLIAALACVKSLPGEQFCFVSRRGIATDAEDEITAALSVSGDPLLVMGCNLVHELCNRGPYDRCIVPDVEDSQQHEAGLRMCEAVCASAVTEGVLELGYLPSEMVKYLEPVGCKRPRSPDKRR